jgi:pyruvate dehydrogenase E1 component
MEECVDGEYQNFKARDGAYVREHFFGKYPKLAEMVADYSDEDIWHLNRGGHDPTKVYAAYAEAVRHTGQPTVILAKTVKGYGMGTAGEGLNITHQQKKMSPEDLKRFRDRFQIPIADEQIAEAPFYIPDPKSPEVQYIKQHREQLGGFLPSRQKTSMPLTIPSLETFNALLQGTGERHISTTMAFVRFLTILARDKDIGKRVVPIVPDESRTFGMEGLFKQLGIYSSVGQLYEPVDAEQLLAYHESKDGQILQEGINEAGGICSWIAAGTSYANNDFPMIPFYIFYSMFGFQRVGDFIWAAADMQAKGFLLGGTAGRTTLAGEGLQHQDGHSHIMAATIPNCHAYDPAFNYELAVILHDGLRRMYTEQENCFYYLTVMNENYEHPVMPRDPKLPEQIIKGMYLFKKAKPHKGLTPQLLGSGAILQEVIKAQQILADDYAVHCDIWSVTSFNELAREAMAVARQNALHPDQKPHQSYVSTCLAGKKGPIIAATDYIRLYAEQIRPYIDQTYQVLGTDGFGRSDTRQQLRHFFEVSAQDIAYATLHALHVDGQFSSHELDLAKRQLGIDPEKPNPTMV